MSPPMKCQGHIHRVFGPGQVLAPVAFAWNDVLQGARGPDLRLQAHAIDHPRKGERPVQLLREGAGGKVVEKVPTWAA